MQANVELLEHMNGLERCPWFASGWQTSRSVDVDEGGKAWVVEFDWLFLESMCSVSFRTILTGRGMRTSIPNVDVDSSLRISISHSPVAWSGVHSPSIVTDAVISLMYTASQSREKSKLVDLRRSLFQSEGGSPAPPIDGPAAATLALSTYL